MMNTSKTIKTSNWFMETKEGHSFHFASGGLDDTVSPLVSRREDFADGDAFFIVDVGDDDSLFDTYETFPDDDSFVLIPQSSVVRTWKEEGLVIAIGKSMSILDLLRGEHQVMFKWRHGRQSGGYKVLTLFSGAAWFPVDCHVIHYPIGSSIPPHTDPVEHGYAHHRLNVILLRSTVGGIFYLDGVTANSRITYFRPDITIHEVSPILIGSRMVLSFGWKKKISG